MQNLPPQDYSQSGYQQRPRVNADDFRHNHEVPAAIATVAIAILALIVFGQLTNAMLALIIPIIFMVLGIVLASVTNQGHMVQVTANQFPELWKMANEIADKLDMKVPPIFVQQSPVINAFAGGIGKYKTVVFHSALLENMSEREIATVMAHEFGHLKCNHSIYLILQRMTAGNLVSNILFMPLKWLFFYSSRIAEYSADRAALIGTNDLMACVTSQIKLSVGPGMFEQMNIQAYMQQIDEFNASAASRFVEFIQDRTHPMTVNRVQAAIRFYRSPEYQRLAAAHGRAGTSTLTSGDVGTRDLFHRIAAKAEYERDIQVIQPGRAPRQAVQASQQSRSGSSSMGRTGSISCGSCGIPLEHYARFCLRCGTPVAGTAPVTGQPDTAIPAPPTSVPQPQVVRRVVRHTGPQQMEPAAAGSAQIGTPQTGSRQAQQETPAAHPTPAPVQASMPLPNAATVASAANTRTAQTAPTINGGACSGCQSQVPPGTKFCGNCGHTM